MNSIDEECTPPKSKYDDCFNAWFRDSFLKGRQDRSHDQICGELLSAYQSCLKACYYTNQKCVLIRCAVFFPHRKHWISTKSLIKSCMKMYWKLIERRNIERNSYVRIYIFHIENLFSFYKRVILKS